jgi:hypothetical protein
VRLRGRSRRARSSRRSLPVIGFLTAGSPRLSADAAFVQGLREGGYVERQNVLIEYRWGRGA